MGFRGVLELHRVSAPSRLLCLRQGLVRGAHAQRRPKRVGRFVVLSAAGFVFIPLARKWRDGRSQKKINK